MTDRDDYFYAGAGRQAALDALFEGIYHAGVVLLLVGPSGAGRSALLHRFRAEADPQVLLVAAVNGDILMSPDQLFAGFCHALGVQPGHQPADTLWQVIAQSRAEERNLVLVVDDAHELGSESRAAITRYARDVDVALVLAGDESLAPDMDPEVAFEVIALRPLDEEETEAFVAGWLAVDDEDELPSHRVIARLHRQSAGLPGRLVALLGADGTQRAPLLSNGIPPWHLFLGGAALVVLAAMVALVLFMSPPTEDDAPVELAITLPPAAGTPAGKQVMSAVVPQPIDTPPMVPQPMSEATADTATMVAQPPPAAAQTASGSALPVALPPATLPLTPPPAPVAAPVAPTPVAATPAAVPVTSGRHTPDEAALLAEPRSRYTVQLFASFNEAAVQQFRKRHAGTDIRIFRTVREELPWFVAVTGSFRNRDEARAGISRLPLDLQALKPWARSLQGIQDEVRRRAP